MKIMCTRHRTAQKVLAGLALVALLLGGTSALADKITLTAGSVGGGYFKAAAALAEYIKAEIPGAETTVIPGGGWANTDRLDSGFADIAVLTNPLVTLAYKGDSPTGKKYDFRVLASVRGPNFAQAAIVADTGIKSWADIKERKFPLRVTMLEPAQIDTAIALDLMAAEGVSKEDIKSWGGKIIYTSQTDAIRMIHDGLADMWFNGGAFYPHSKYIQFGAKKKFRLLPFSKDVAQKVADKYGMEILQVPAGVYDQYNGSNESYWSPTSVVVFGVRTGLSDDLVYEMAKALAKHKEEFWKVNPQHKFYQPEVAWKNTGDAPLHPGAARFYREMGYMK